MQTAHLTNFAQVLHTFCTHFCNFFLTISRVLLHTFRVLFTYFAHCSTRFPRAAFLKSLNLRPHFSGSRQRGVVDVSETPRTRCPPSPARKWSGRQLRRWPGPRWGLPLPIFVTNPTPANPKSRPSSGGCLCQAGFSPFPSELLLGSVVCLPAFSSYPLLSKRCCMI